MKPSLLIQKSDLLMDNINKLLFEKEALGWSLGFPGQMLKKIIIPQVFMAHLHKFNKRKIEMKHLLYSFGVNSVILSHQTHTQK